MPNACRLVRLGHSPDIFVYPAYQTYEQQEDAKPYRSDARYLRDPDDTKTDQRHAQSQNNGGPAGWGHVNVFFFVCVFGCRIHSVYVCEAPGCQGKMAIVII